MPELKIILFEHAKDYYEKWQGFKRFLGEKNEMTIKCENKYYGCHLVIAHSGLEPEYENRLQNQRKEIA